MNLGRFLGIREKMMSIEYDALIIENDERRIEKRIFSYSVRAVSHRDTCFKGFDKGIPDVGDLVGFDSPSPDMAGHLMVSVMPVKVFTGICRDIPRQVHQKTQLRARRVRQTLIENVQSEDGTVSRDHLWVDDWHGILPGPVKFYGAVVGDGHIDFIEVT